MSPALKLDGKCAWPMNHCTSSRRGPEESRSRRDLDTQHLRGGSRESVCRASKRGHEPEDI